MNKLTRIAFTLLCCLPLHAAAQNTPATDGRMEAEYRNLSRSYTQQDPRSFDRMQAYLDKYPDTPHANRLHALMASIRFREEAYEEALALFQTTQLNLLGDEERDDLTYQRATCYLKTGDDTQAAIWYEALRQISPRYQEDCTYYLSYIRYTQQRYDEALIGGFLSLQGSTKYKAIVPYYIAEVYLQKKQYDKAENVAQSYLSGYKDNEYTGEMRRILGEVNYYYGKYREAMRYLEAYIEAPTTTTPRRDALYMLGVSYHYCDVYHRAIETLGEVTVTANDALTQNAYLHIGLAYLKQGDKTRARMAFEQAAASDADLTIKEQAAYNYALCIRETAYSAFGESVTAFEKFLNDFPQSRYADLVSNYLIDVYMSTRSYEAALQSIARIARPSATILAAKQNILFRLGTQAVTNAQFEQAIDFFDRSIALGQYNEQTKADACYWRGESFYRLGQMTEAAANFNDYLTLTNDLNSDTYALAYYNLGYIAFHRKNYPTAQERFLRFVQLAGNNSSPAVVSDACNRIGDCYMNYRRFEEAKQYYTRADSDYSLYQLALIAGLQRDYDTKVQLLDRLESRYPASPYLVNAAYEKGRSYVQRGNNTQAIGVFRNLLARYPDNPVSRKAAVEIGLLYYQNGDYNQAIEAYKQVATRYPGSDEARLALRDLKSIYIDANRIDEYAALANTLPGADRIDAGEQDTLTYLAAEKVYQKGEIAQAENSMTRYLETYPNGSFSEEALTIRAQIRFDRKQYAAALPDYKLLQSRTTDAARRRMANTGVMRCAVWLHNDAETVGAATELLADTKLPPELANEARYNRAKSYLNTHNDPQALPDLQALAKDTRTQYGAEAKYLVAQQFYNSKQYDQAETEILNFIEQGSTEHSSYWMARSFILLSDVYVAMDKPFDARQYLLSLQQSYHANDDIAGMINERLEKLNRNQDVNTLE
ncbi:MAG: tetratricopeptide repeat protein [Prevotellaceae bacterium]|jgi:TolA-binding protein|nr:tetratricopeptide repeat protein [Prevotellaceae bacterium]